MLDLKPHMEENPIRKLLSYAIGLLQKDLSKPVINIGTVRTSFFSEFVQKRFSCERHL